VSVAGQHLQDLVPGYGLDLHNIQESVLEKATGGFVTQIMEIKPLNSCQLADTPHRFSDGI
jgi:hypothetical protein